MADAEEQKYSSYGRALNPSAKARANSEKNILCGEKQQTALSEPRSGVATEHRTALSEPRSGVATAHRTALSEPRSGVAYKAPSVSKSKRTVSSRSSEKRRLEYELKRIQLEKQEQLARLQLEMQQLDIQEQLEDLDGDQDGEDSEEGTVASDASDRTEQWVRSQRDEFQVGQKSDPTTHDLNQEESPKTHEMFSAAQKCRGQLNPNVEEFLPPQMDSKVESSKFRSGSVVNSKFPSCVPVPSPGVQPVKFPAKIRPSSELDFTQSNVNDTENFRSRIEVSSKAQFAHTSRPRDACDHDESVHADENDCFDDRSIHIGAGSVPNTSDWIDTADINQNRMAELNPILAATTALLNNDLPQASLEKFDGSALRWCEWSLTFKNRVHDNPALSTSKKLAYLQAYLGEGPKGRIFGLLWDPKNYGEALKELKRIYGNATTIVEAYIDSVKKWKNPQTPHEICSFSISVTNLVQIFRSMGFHSDLSAHGLLSDLLKKLPDHMKKSWGRFVQRTGHPTVERFEKWLSREEEALRLGGALSSKAENHNRDRQGQFGGPGLSRSMNAMTQGNGPGNGSRGLGGPDPRGAPWQKCEFCESTSHWLDKCFEFGKKSDEDRVRWFTSGKRCYRCAKTGHIVTKCRSAHSCRLKGCADPRGHTTCLHSAATQFDPPTDSEAPATVTLDVEHVASAKSDVYLQILPIRVHSPDGVCLDTVAMLDPGSQGTLITEALSDKLGLKGPYHDLCLRNVAKDAATQRSKKVRFWVSDPADPHKPAIPVHEAWTYGSLSLPSQAIPRDESREPLWAHLKGLDLRDIDAREVQVLIGANSKELLRTCDIVRGAVGEPDAILTPLGWTLLGGSPETETLDRGVHNVQISDQSDLNATVEKFWSIDEFGCRFDDTESFSIEDRRALKMLDSGTKFNGSRYVVPMLWKEEAPVLENNRYQAEQRYRSLARKLLKDSNLKEQYTEAMNKYIEKGHAVKLTEPEVGKTSDLTHYLIHFAVFHPTKKTCRVVFDAALSYRGLSMNEHLMMGPFLTNTLVGILLRFRQGAIPLSADIEACFHQVLVPDRDRDALRFLWSPSLSDKPDTYRWNVHVFGAKCSPSCATYAIKRTATDNGDKFSELATSQALKSYYMDDFMTSVDSEESAVSLAREMIEMTAKCGFTLTKWVSTSPAVLKAVQSDGAQTNIDLDLDSDATSRVLGIRWDVPNDTFYFSIKPDLNRRETKRGMLSLSCSIFDPMGFLAPYTVRARMVIQSLWEIKGQGWDDPVTGPILSVWRQWVSELLELEKFRLPRKFWPGAMKPVHVSMHYFGDASESCYAACAYLRVVYPAGQIHCSFVLSRSRLAPIGAKRLTLPRLELQAAVLAVRLSLSVGKELDLEPDKTHFWSDSITVIKYFHNDGKRFKTFEANRIAEVRSSSKPEQWRHCPGPQNPADDATRGVSMASLNEPGGRWLHAPGFLWETEDKWPSNASDTSLKESDPGLKSVGKLIAQTALTVDLPLINPCNVSNWKRLTRVTAWAMRFAHNTREKDKIKRLKGPLSAAEVGSAGRWWIKQAQREYPDEMKLQNGETVATSSAIRKLSPFVDQRGILRVGGRIQEANIPYGCKHQMILPSQHPVAFLLVKECHGKLLHAGVEHVVCQIRQSYWIPKLRPLVKKVLAECRTCRREFAQPAIPKMAPLPAARLSANEPVWSHTGVDLFGPILVKERRSQVKRWAIIFCSMSVRAIHLDLVRSMSADSFIMSLRRFIARRGEVCSLYMDCGSNFVGAEPEIKAAYIQLMSDPRVKDSMSVRGIEFHYNPPKASHMGGAWERLIRSVKRAMRATLRDHTVHEDVLYTSLCEIEAALNSRPLSYCGDDPDHPTPLTPNHFLHHADTTVSAPDLVLTDDSTCRKKWRISQFITEQLWRRWLREYLPTLNMAQKWLREKRALSVGDVVLIADKNSPRGVWPLAKVEEVYPGRDGRIRSAKLKTKTGYLFRPVSSICVLEEANSN